jgi:hypothetical protein
MCRVSRRLEQRLAWISLCALLFAALAPGLGSLAHPERARTGWQAICGTGPLAKADLQGLATAGSPAALSAASDRPNPSSHGADFGHCPWCLLQQAGSVIAAGTADGLPAPVQARHEAPRPSPTRASGRDFLALPHSRGPPAFS